MNSKVRGHIQNSKLVFALMLGTNFFSNCVVNAWNELPQFVVDSETVNSFRARLDKFYASKKCELSNLMPRVLHI